MKQEYDKNFIMRPKIDFASKEIMMNDKALTSFLSAVLDVRPETIKKIIRKNTNMQKTHEDEKQNILDVRIVMNDSKEIDIEIQLSYMAAWADRSVFYVAKMLVEQVDIDKKYSNIKKCIGINILDFDYVKQSERFHTAWHVREDTEHIKYTDVLEWHLIELPKLPEMIDGTDLYKWGQFLRAETKEEFQMIVQGNQYLESAFDTLQVISQDEQKQLEYTARMTALYDYNTQMEENYDRGRTDRDIELIAKWKARGMTDTEIKKLLS